MTFFQFKSFSFSFSFVNRTIKRIVQYIKSNGKFYIANLTNETFWKDTPRGQEILEFFGGMTHSQKIEFLGCFDIFVVGFHNGINAYVTMTADPSSRNFKKTILVSISKGYNCFSEKCSGRTTPSIEGDLRSSIGSTPVQPAEYSTSPAVSQHSNLSAFQQGLSSFEPFQGFGGQIAQPFSSFQGFGGPVTQPVSPFQGFGRPMSGFSLFRHQLPSFRRYFEPIAQGGSTDLFTSQADFIPVESMNKPVIYEGQTRLAIQKGHVISVKIPLDCSSGPSTSSTVRGIAKSPKAKTPIAITIANLEKKIARLERGNLAEESLGRLELNVARAKLEKIQNSL
jgi:hypothetical protein